MDPPPTAQPWKMVACLKNCMLKKPRRPRLGRQIQRWMDQLVRGRLSGVQRRPISMTATRYPFSASRRAETLPPKPEPITMKSKSKSNWRLRGATDSSPLGSRFLAIFRVIVLFTARPSLYSSALELLHQSLAQSCAELRHSVANRVQTAESHGSCPPRFRGRHPRPASGRDPRRLECSRTESRRGQLGYRSEEVRAGQPISATPADSGARPS